MPRPTDWKPLSYKAIAAVCARSILGDSSASISRTYSIGKNTLKPLRLAMEAAGLKKRSSDPTRGSDVLESVRRKRTSRAVDKSNCEELRRRSEQHHIDRAKTRILQRVARGLPINVFERRLIAGDLPPGF